MAHSTARVAWTAGAARVVGLGLSLVSMSFLLRAVGLSGYGHFATATSILTLVAAVGEIGLTALVARDLPVAVDQDRYLKTLWRARWWSLGFVSLGGVVVVLGLKLLGVPIGGGVLALAVLNFLSQLVSALSSAVGFAVGRGARVVAMELAGKLLWILSTVGLFVWSGSWLLALALISVTSAMPFIAYRWVVGGHAAHSLRTSTPSRSDVWDLLRSGGVLAALPIIYLTFNRADILGLSLGASSAQVGRYATCYRLADALLGVMAGAAAALMPALAAAATRRERHERGRQRLLLGVGWAVAVGTAASPLWLRILAGSGFIVSVTDVWVVTLLAIGVIFYTGLQIDMTALVAARAHKSVSAVLLGAAVIEGLGSYLAGGSLVVVAVVVAGIEAGAVVLSSELCRRCGLVGSRLRGGWLPAFVALGVAWAETVAGVSYWTGLVATGVVGVAALLTPSVRRELLVVVSRLPYVGVAGARLLQVGLRDDASGR